MQLQLKTVTHLLLWAIFTLPISIHAQVPVELAGVVQRVIDGDTLVLLDATDTKHTLRLAGIDAPESRMPFGRQAKAHLAELVLGQNVVAMAHKQDRYGRTIATVLVGGQDANLAMVQVGLAWHYAKYAKEQPVKEAARYAAAEHNAHLQGLGLWHDGCPVPPWAWRHSRKSTSVKMGLAITVGQSQCL